MTEPLRYRVYLLRLWRADADSDAPTWRASLEDARSGQRHGFPDLEQLYAFLGAQTQSWAEPDEPSSDIEL